MKKTIIVNIILIIILNILLTFCSCDYGITTVSISLCNYDSNNDFIWEMGDNTLYKWRDNDSDISKADSYIWNRDEDNVNCKITIYSLPNNFLVVNYRNKGYAVNDYQMKTHIKDELLLINNDNKTVSKVYECPANERIIYGCIDYVIIYNSDQNQYNYISLTDNTLISTQKASLKKGKEYFAYLKDDCIELENDGYNSEIIDTINLIK